MDVINAQFEEFSNHNPQSEQIVLSMIIVASLLKIDRTDKLLQVKSPHALKASNHRHILQHSATI